jgi:undecaprenyl-diphosphatase
VTDPLSGPARTFDDAVERWLEPRRSPALDRLFYSLSSAADHGFLWLAIGGLRTARTGDPRAARRLGVALGVESALTNGLVKSFFGRIRPPHDQPAGPLPYGMHRPITSSFPSGHAVTAFTAAVLLADRTRLGPLYFGLASLVAASRVYVRMHHASDVIAGAALGLAFGSALRKVLPLRPSRS